MSAGVVGRLASFDDQLLTIAPMCQQLFQGLDLAFFKDSANHWLLPLLRYFDWVFLASLFYRSALNRISPEGDVLRP
jgi:hypothetical protein